MTECIELTAPDGHVLRAWLTMPVEKARGGLVVIHEFLGVTPYILSVCAAYAADGYAVVAPALYDRQEAGAIFEATPEDFARATQLRQRLVWGEVMADVTAARNYLAPFGKCGIIGFCLGGSVAWLAASHPGFAASVSYYGKDVPDWLDKKPLCPVILHFGETDNLIPLTGVENIRAAYPHLPVHVYPAGHAFDNPDKAVDPAISASARQRSLALLRAHVG